MQVESEKTSYVYFVGSGPGDPELITIKAKGLLEKADIVVYAGSLVKGDVLKYCRSAARLLNSAGMNLDEIMSVMINASREGQRVVRLHSGDPSLYSALREQTEILDREGIPYRVVPGVSSAFASAAALGRELTIPQVTQTVIFTRMEGRTPVPEKERLCELSLHQATMCIFLSIGMIEEVVAELKRGYPMDTPVAVVSRVSWDDEEIIEGRLNDISEKVRTKDINRQAMIIVGNVLSSQAIKCPSRLYDRDFEHGFRKKVIEER